MQRNAREADRHENENPDDSSIRFRARAQQPPQFLDRL
jgi:hypothetical protein